MVWVQASRVEFLPNTPDDYGQKITIVPQNDGLTFTSVTAGKRRFSMQTGHRDEAAAPSVIISEIATSGA